MRNWVRDWGFSFKARVARSSLHDWFAETTS